MADLKIQKIVSAVDAFFDHLDHLGGLPKRSRDKVQSSMWALVDDLGIDLDEFQRAYDRHWRAKHR